jgi:hypothetical protein
MVGGMNLLGARRGAKQAGNSAESLLVGLGGKFGVFGVCVRLAFKGGHKILNRNLIFRGNSGHEQTSPTPFKSLRALEEASL